MDTRKLILDRLIECNPDSQELKAITVDNFNISDIQPVTERTAANGVKINARVRLRCLIDTGWVGSRYVWFYRYDAATTIPEQVCNFPANKTPTTRAAIVKDIFDYMHLDFDKSWIDDPDEMVSHGRILDEEGNTIGFKRVDVTFNNNSFYFIGSFEIKIVGWHDLLNYLPVNNLELWKPLLPPGDTRQHLLLYGFEFALGYSVVNNKEIIKSIKSQSDLVNNIQLVTDVISDLSSDVWTIDSDPQSPRPAGCFKYIYNGYLNNDNINEIFGKYTMLPINRSWPSGLVLRLELPTNSTCRFAGEVIIYYR